MKKLINIKKTKNLNKSLEKRLFHQNKLNLNLKDKNWSDKLLKNDFFKKLTDSLGKISYQNFAMIDKVEEGEKHVNRILEMIGKKTIEFYNKGHHTNSLPQQLMYDKYIPESVKMEYSKIQLTVECYDQNLKDYFHLQILADVGESKVHVVNFLLIEDGKGIKFQHTNFFFPFESIE